jgi:hypothetical protein
VQLRFGEDAVGEGLSGGGVLPVGAVPGPGRVPAGAVRDVEHLQADDGPALGGARRVDGGRFVPGGRRCSGSSPKAPPMTGRGEAASPPPSSTVIATV